MGLTAEEIKNDKQQYSSTLLLEAVNKQISRLSECDKLFIVSDMCVVDRNGNNFERQIFAMPPNLRTKAKVDIRRVARKGQPLKAIRQIEAWWHDALYGGSAFKREDGKYADAHQKIRSKVSRRRSGHKVAITRVLPAKVKEGPGGSTWIQIRQ